MADREPYSVYEVAKILEVNPETVRRWIRSGKLKSAYQCDKFGHFILPGELMIFAYSDSKYSEKYEKNVPDV